MTKDLTLDLNGHTVTNNVTANRLFRLSDISFTIDGGGGKVVTSESNAQSYGFVDFRDADGTAGASTSLTVRDASFEGATDEGSLFAFRGDGQKIDLTDVNVNLTGGNTFSIINGYRCEVDISVKGGEHVCNSTHATAGAFQAGAGSTIEFDGVMVNTSVGPVFEVIASEAAFTGCTMINTATNSYFAACVAVSNGAAVNVYGSMRPYVEVCELRFGQSEAPGVRNGETGGCVSCRQSSTAGAGMRLAAVCVSVSRRVCGSQGRSAAWARTRWSWGA